MDKSTLKESCDTGSDTDKTFVVDWGRSITLQNFELADGNWIASSKVTNIEDEDFEMYVVDNVPNSNWYWQRWSSDCKKEICEGV